MLNDPNFRDKLRAITSSSSIEAIKSIAFKLKNEVAVLAKENKTIEVDPDKVNALTASLEKEIDDLKTGFDYIIDILQIYQKDNDKILPDIMSVMEASITDFKSATDATYEYDRQWFQRALLSESAKVELAGFLLSLISKYTKSNLDTLLKISQGDEDVMELIRFPELPFA